MRHPFSEAELFEVYGRVMPEPEARAEARAALAPAARGPVTGGGAGLSFQTVSEPVLSFDTLVLLSLLSDETKAKAERYLENWHRGSPMPDSLRAQWERRRAELKEWADAGYPRSD